MKRFLTLILLITLGCATAPPAAPTPRALRLEDLTLDQKIGQLFVYAANGDFLNSGSAEWQKLERVVREEHVGGIHWYAADVLETAWMNSRLQQLASVPLLVSADLESGIGMRFGDGTNWPWAMAMAATGDTTLIEEAGSVVAREALSVGINQIYAPVADVNNNPDNPVINVRSFGEDPAEVARFVSSFVRGVESEGVLATAKHFPGHGDTQTDSHRSLPVLGVDRARLDRVELVPFRAAIAAGVDSVMIAHLSLPEIDPTPAPVRPGTTGENPYGTFESEIAIQASIPSSLSPRVVTGLLREDLGFEGLVVTDALDMGGIVQHFDAGEASVRAIEAGVDQVVKPHDIDVALAGVKAAIASGRISEARIDESVRRILAAKSGLAPEAFDASRVSRIFDAPEHRAFASTIAARAITLLREEPGTLPIDPSARVVEIVVSDFPEPFPPLSAFARGLQERLGTPPVRILLDRRSVVSEAEAAVGAARDADVVILSLVVRTRSGAGRTGIPEIARAAIDAIVALERAGGPEVVAISFGNPYVIRESPELPTYLVTYGPQPLMQQAAARAIFGESPIGGRIPVSVPGLFPRGSGIVRGATAP